MATSSKDIFDEVEIEGDIFDKAAASPLGSPKKGTRALNVGAGKAIAGAVGAPGDIASLVGLGAKDQLPGQKALAEAEATIPEHLLPFLQQEDIAPYYHRLPTSEEVGQLLEVPEPRNRTERYLAKLGQTAGSATALGGAGALGPLLAGSAAGQTVEEAGGGPLAAALTDIGVSTLGGGLQRGLTLKKSQKQLGKALRERGFSDKEITPLVASEKKLRSLGKYAPKNEKLSSSLGNSRKKVAQIYENVREKGSTAFLRGNGLENFEEGLGEALGKVRPRFRRLIGEELEAFNSSEKSVRNLMDLYQDVNAVVKGEEGGKAVLNLLKKPIIEGIGAASPELVDDFVVANTMYSRLGKAAKILKPGNLDAVLDIGEIVGLADLTVNPSVGKLKRLAGAVGGRKLAQALITEPSLQNLRSKLGEAVKKGKEPAIRAAFGEVMTSLQKSHPDVFDEIDWEEVITP